MNALTVKSPAKINLILYVLGKRADGYHKLATLFHRISLADDIQIKKRKQGFLLQCSNPRVPTDESNLITQAYRALQNEFPQLGGVYVSLTKRIPIGAGLGGGSSNAAFFLLAMKKLYKLRISRERLLKIGGRLGADVPFFLYDVNQAFATGRGDRIQPMPAKALHRFVLVLQNKGLSTKKVFENHQKQAKAPSLTKVSRAVTMLCEFLEKRDFEKIAKSLHNDLESSAFRLRPSLRKIINQFETMGDLSARMSGSGPTVFAVVSNAKQAGQLVIRLQKRFADYEVVHCHTK